MRENPLRAWRKARRLTAVTVAHKMALSEQSILCFERGSFEPSQENFDKLADLMETLPGALRLSWHFWKSDLNHKGELHESANSAMAGSARASRVPSK